MISEKTQNLHGILKDLQSVVIGLSGGVDSSLLAKLCLDILGRENVWVVTGNSKSVMPEELEFCRELAKWLRLDDKHFIIVETDEINDPNYAANPEDRCYFCKHELFGKLTEIAGEVGAKYVIDGSNASDMSDYRPGRKASQELKVRAPLAEAGFNKDDIRSLARELGLPNWNKPSMPCLASRIPYKSKVTVEKLEQIAEAERFLRKLGFRQFRVRHHDKIARIELDDFSLLLKNGTTEQINEHFKQIGFTYVTVDLGGFKSGSLNIGIEGNKND
jgi:uncharacterized protein